MEGQLLLRGQFHVNFARGREGVRMARKACKLRKIRELKESLPSSHFPL